MNKGLEIEKTVIAVCLDLLDIVFVKNDFITLFLKSIIIVAPGFTLNSRNFHF